MTTKNIIEVRAVSKKFTNNASPVEAVKDVSFSIKAGSCIAITGSSGSGKTTLLHMIGMLESPSKGEILINGKNINKLNENKQAKFRNEMVGFVFQDFHLFPHLTVLENVMIPFLFSDNQEGSKHHALDAIEKVGLTKRKDFPTRFLSGGEKQRTAIARSLMPQPEIILADEPTGNLDSKTGEKIIKLLFDLQKNAGITLIIVTHDQELAKRADKIIHIQDGQVQTK